MQAGFYNKTNHLANQPSFLFALFFFLSPLLTLSIFLCPEALPFLYVFSFLSSLRSLRLSPSPSSHLFLTFALSLSLCLALVACELLFHRNAQRVHIALHERVNISFNSWTPLSYLLKLPPSFRSEAFSVLSAEWAWCLRPSLKMFFLKSYFINRTFKPRAIQGVEELET